MFDRRDRAIVNVRIHSKLRWRRNGNGNRGTRHRGDVGHDGNIGNVDIIGNVKHRDTGNLGHVWNVRFRFEQHCFIVNANVHVAHSARRSRSNRTSIGIYRDRQPWCQLRGSRTNDDRIAHCGCRGTDSAIADDAGGWIAVRCFVSCDKSFPVPKRRHRRHIDWRLLK
jgi:hypothetical protein